MFELIEKEEKDINELETVKCPICDEEFRDLRGLTSHARHTHDLSREEIYNIIQTEKDEKGDFWKIFAGASTFILALLTLGKLR